MKQDPKALVPADRKAPGAPEETGPPDPPDFANHAEEAARDAGEQGDE
jgi:hypothetical protein